MCHNGSEHQRKKTNVSFTLHDWNYSRKWFIVAAFFLFRIAPTICNCFTCYKYPRRRCFIIVYAEIFFVASQHIWKKKLKSLNESTENTLIIINFVDKLGPIKMFRFGSFANYCLSFSPTWTKSFFWRKYDLSYLWQFTDGVGLRCVGFVRQKIALVRHQAIIGCLCSVAAALTWCIRAWRTMNDDWFKSEGIDLHDDLRQHYEFGFVYARSCYLFIFSLFTVKRMQFSFLAMMVDCVRADDELMEHWLRIIQWNCLIDKWLRHETIIQTKLFRGWK